MKDSEADKRIIVGFDMDGVILNLTEHKMKLAAQRGIVLSARETQSDIMKTVVPADIHYDIQMLLYREPHYTLSAPIMDHVEETLEALSQADIPFYLISRRKVYTPAIERFKAAGFWPKYFHDDNTYFVDKPEDKNFRAQNMGVTHFVDDEVAILNVLRDVPNKILFDTVEAYPDWNNTPRATHWDELLELLT